MVSLINFKIVDDELAAGDAHQQQQTCSTRPDLSVLVRVGAATNTETAIPTPPSSSTNAKAPVTDGQRNHATDIDHISDSPDTKKDTNGIALEPAARAGQVAKQDAFRSTIRVSDIKRNTFHPESVPNLMSSKLESATAIAAVHTTETYFEPAQSESISAPDSVDSGNFTVTWRKLRYVIEPKWHQKLMHQLNSVCGGGQSNAISVADGKQDKTQELDASSNSSKGSALPSSNNISKDGNANNSCLDNHFTAFPGGKIVLDELDGSFKSGELTAILGPSGAGKTTLLDCLTGHKRSGLSGSVRMSGHTSFRDPNQATKLKDGSSRIALTKNSTCGEQSAGRDRNLRVSIIPQKDHLMGHLTVYETLSYASKMKNCFDRKFNHKSNIESIAQQLGLVSCLGTRINKLSGGQYKRVSIAQELLSSPDVLILDEPTSGLDAMTCYQTVEVLRKLTESNHGNQHQRQMAVILTIHQPNSDVFQQFNHVYVVAQGGKCIFEGSPSSIDSAISRIGIELPSVNYNPATLIVEVAAGKFGLDAINKLNCLQRKQYFNDKHDSDGRQGAHKKSKRSSDEQTSTGDSAVECPSSTSSISFGNNSDDDENDRASIMDDATDTEDPARDKNNNNLDYTDSVDDKQIGGQINRAFAMESSRVGGDGIIVVNLPSATSDGETDQEENKQQLKMVMSGDRRQSCRKRAAVKRQKPKQALNSDCGDTSNNNNNNNDHDHHIVRESHQQSHYLNQDFNHNDLIINRHLGLGEQSRNEHHSGLDDEDTLPISLGSATRISSNHLEIDFDHSNKANDNDEGTNKRPAHRRQGMRNRLENRQICSGANGSGDRDFGNNNNNSEQNRPEKRLKLNSLKAGQNFPFWRHTYLHFHRSWVSIVRDPMLCGMQLTLHILVPLMVSLVYGSKVGKPNACPRAGPVDIMAYAVESNDSALQLQEDLRTTLENIGYIFFKLYGIIFAAMTVTVLTFPLDMHVLVKEFRNGWYGLSSYFIGRTLADVPFQLTLPLLAMSLSYYATGQPYSYMQWRFLSITGILILSSLIAQSQGLLFGAILMDRMKAAVFVAPAATTPIILFAGFLVRTQSIPSYLRPLSNISYLRYAIEACLISRYGFNQCECDPAVFNQTVPELPPIARSMLDYWLSSFKPPSDDPLTTASSALNSTTSSSVNNLGLNSNNNLTASALVQLTTVSPETAPTSHDLFGKLMDSLARANSFGRNITSCEQVVPYPMIDYNLKDSQLFNCFAILTTMLIVTRMLTFFIVSFKVKRKV